MNDEVFSLLLDMGFGLADCQRAAEFGCSTVEQAVNFLSSPMPPNQIEQTSATLTLTKPAEKHSPRATMSGQDTSSSVPVVQTRYSETIDAQRLLEEKRVKSLQQDLLREKERKRLDHEAIRAEIQADKKARQDLRPENNLPDTGISEKEKQPFEIDDQVLKSRIEQNNQEEMDFNNKMCQRITEQKRKEKEAKEAARIETLRRIEEDRIAKTQPKDSQISANQPTEIKSQSPSHLPVSNIPSQSNALINIRFRFPSGESLTEKFIPSAPVSVVLHFVGNHLKCNDFTLAESFPPFNIIDHSMYDKTLRSLNMGSNVALIVKVKASTESALSERPQETIATPAVADTPAVAREVIADGSDSESSVGEDIPYQPLHDNENSDENEEPMLVDGEEETVAQRIRSVLQHLENNQSPGDEDGDDDGNMDSDDDMPRNPTFPLDVRHTTGAHFNIAQQLGGSPGGDYPATAPSRVNNDAAEVETLEMRRQRMSDAVALRRIQRSEGSDDVNRNCLTYSCSTLKLLCAEFVIRSYLEQKITNISCIDTSSAEFLLQLLRQKQLLNAKTYHLFITSGISHLDLAGYPYLTNELVRAVSFGSLSRLNLKSGLSLTDVAVSHIVKITSLRQLVVSHCSNLTSGAICRILESLRLLELLEVANTKLNSNSLRCLLHKGQSYECLKVFDCSETLINSLEGFDQLFPRLVSLTVNSTTVTSLKPLVNLASLSYLSAVNCPALSHSSEMYRMSCLKFLDITNSCQPEDLKPILESVQTSNLSNFKFPLKSKCDDSHLILLAKLSLAEIDFSNCSLLTSGGLNDYFETLVSLNCLSVRVLVLSNTALDSRCLPLIDKLTSLNELNLDYTNITDADLTSLQNLTVLTTLSLVGNNLSDKMFLDNDVKEPQVFSLLVSLTKLNLSRNAALTNFGLKRLQHPNLESIALIQTKVTDAIQEVMKHNSPKLRSISLRPI